MTARQAMLLLLGGTSDTAVLAESLAQAGHRVLVSQATEVPLEIGRHPLIEARRGALDDAGLMELIRQQAITAIVDAAHPYATTIHQRAQRVAAAINIAYLRFVRPTSIGESEPGVEFAADHESAAQRACAYGQPVLLTTGSRNLPPYAAESQRTGTPLIVRVLDHPASLAACRAAGLTEPQILTGRGPFSVDENRHQIRRFRIGTLVTKDSGVSGGTAEKLAAARAENCRVIVVERPPSVQTPAFSDAAAIVRALQPLETPVSGASGGKQVR